VSEFRKATKGEIEAAIPHLAELGVRVELLNVDLLAMTLKQRADSVVPWPEPTDKAAWNDLQLASLYAIRELERYLNARGLSTAPNAQVDANDARDSLERSDVACEAFRTLAQVWNLSREQQAQLLGVAEDLLVDWLAHPERKSLGDDHLARVFLLANIFADLQSFYGSTTHADAWPHRPNSHFGGRTPLARMLDGLDGLEEIRLYAWRMVG
jgi:hypothetical protein